MTKLEEKLIASGFTKHIDHKNTIYSKDCITITLNDNNTEIWRYNECQIISLNINGLKKYLKSSIKILEELELIERELRLEELSNAMYEECD